MSAQEGGVSRASRFYAAWVALRQSWAEMQTDANVDLYLRSSSVTASRYFFVTTQSICLSPTKS
jgi:hypothetical protein